MFKLVAAPVLMPAQTLIGSTVGPVVDTEVTLQTGGRVYLSETEVAECAKFFPERVCELAESMGWVAPHAAAAKDERIAELEEQVTALQDGAPHLISLEDARALLAQPATVALAIAEGD